MEQILETLLKYLPLLSVIFACFIYSVKKLIEINVGLKGILLHIDIITEKQAKIEKDVTQHAIDDNVQHEKLGQQLHDLGKIVSNFEGVLSQIK
jgi:hypothetical protein